METVFYCGNCNKFFYAEAEAGRFSSVCTHCGSEATGACKVTKEQYATFPNERKEQWKSGIRRAYPTKQAILDYLEQATKQWQRQQYVDNILGVLFQLKGVRGRTLTVCRNKCIIKTDVTVGSVMTGNATDGEKVIFLKNCSGLQFKESGLAIGYLQFETPSMQMNNQGSNFFSENTFTYEANTNGLTNEIMREVFYFVMELTENCAAGNNIIPEIPATLAEYLRKQT